MKLLLVGFFALYSFGVLAHQNRDKLPFEQQKKMKLEHLEKKSAFVEKARGCVSQAKDKLDLKECSEEMKEYKQSMTEEWKKQEMQYQESHKKKGM